MTQNFLLFHNFLLLIQTKGRVGTSFYYKAKEIFIRDLEANLAKALALVSTLVMNSKKHCHPLLPSVRSDFFFFFFFHSSKKPSLLCVDISSNVTCNKQDKEREFFKSSCEKRFYLFIYFQPETFSILFVQNILQAEATRKQFWHFSSNLEEPFKNPSAMITNCQLSGAVHTQRGLSVFELKITKPESLLKYLQNIDLESIRTDCIVLSIFLTIYKIRLLK